MSIESRFQLLTSIKGRSLGVREMIKTLSKRAETVVSLIKEMESMGLVEASLSKSLRKGRPRRVISMTILGEDYLNTLNELRVKPLRSSRNDLVKAKRDAEYVRRLLDRGKDPYRAFLELNSIVRDSGDSA